MSDTPQVDQVRRTLTHWHQNARRNARANYHASSMLQRRHYYLGIPAAILAALVGSSVFATLAGEPAIGWRIVVGMLSIAAAVLSTLQTLLVLADRASKHREAAAGYNALKREIQQAVIFLESSSADPSSILQGLREKMDLLARDTPQVPEAAWERANREVLAPPLSLDEKS